MFIISVKYQKEGTTPHPGSLPPSEGAENHLAAFADAVAECVRIRFGEFTMDADCKCGIQSA